MVSASIVLKETGREERVKRARERMRDASARNSKRPVSKCYPACKKGQSSLARACGNDGGGVARRGNGMTCGMAWQPRAARANSVRRAECRR